MATAASFSNENAFSWFVSPKNMVRKIVELDFFIGRILIRLCECSLQYCYIEKGWCGNQWTTISNYTNTLLGSSKMVVVYQILN
jgi:hypothetical protein